MSCLGAFTAQHFKLLSVDPNTIFQLFVFPDRVFLIKSGTFLNQLPQVLTHGAVKGLLGLRDHAAGGLPTLEEARRLVGDARKHRAFLGFSMANREIPCSQIAQATLSRSGFFSKGLRLQLRQGGGLFFRFLDSSDEELAVQVLRQVLGSRLTVKG